MPLQVNVENSRELTEAMVEYGQAYTVNYMETLGNAESMTLLVRVGDNVRANMTITLQAPTDAVFRTYASPVVSSEGNPPDGVKLTKFNRNTDGQRVSKVDVFSDSVFTNKGTLRGVQPLPAGKGGTAVGAQSGERIPSVVSEGKDFVIELTNDTANTGKFGIILDWYEVDL